MDEALRFTRSRGLTSNFEAQVETAESTWPWDPGTSRQYLHSGSDPESNCEYVEPDLRRPDSAKEEPPDEGGNHRNRAQRQQPAEPLPNQEAPGRRVVRRAVAYATRTHILARALFALPCTQFRAHRGGVPDDSHGPHDLCDRTLVENMEVGEPLLFVPFTVRLREPAGSDSYERPRGLSMVARRDQVHRALRDESNYNKSGERRDSHAG